MKSLTPSLYAFLILLAALCQLVAPGAVLAGEVKVPALISHVNDYADFISPQVRQELEEALKALETNDSTQVVVLTVPDLQGHPLEDFSIKVAQTWGLGRQGKDNGVLVVLAKAERKVRIEVGRGLEGVLTDALAGRIIDQEMIPRFKNQDFDGGVLAGVKAIVQVVKGEYTGTGTRLTKWKFDTHAWAVILALVLTALCCKQKGWVRGSVGGITFSSAAMVLAFSLTGVLVALVGGVVFGLLVPYLLRLDPPSGGGDVILEGVARVVVGGLGSFIGGGASGDW
ncbi:MAG: TPM domain-containing protein [Desulfovibrio sp.]|nr:TPM domain-containing protein [Desulfovibrio sp.]MBI4960331.1 TPM domain-containing protein [Desulfovibrio sp.]